MREKKNIILLHISLNNKYFQLHRRGEREIYFEVKIYPLFFV